MDSASTVTVANASTRTLNSKVLALIQSLLPAASCSVPPAPHRAISTYWPDITAGRSLQLPKERASRYCLPRVQFLLAPADPPALVEALSELCRRGKLFRRCPIA